MVIGIAGNVIETERRGDTMTTRDEWEECAHDALNEQCLTLVDPKSINAPLCWMHEMERLEEDAADNARMIQKEDSWD